MSSLKKVLVPIAYGTEEIEAVVIIDILRRAGIEVVVASVSTMQILASRGVKITADCLLEQCLHDEFDMIVLPGGIPGAEHLRDHKPLIEMLHRHQQAGKYIAAICASPVVVLLPHGFLANHRATCHPGRQNALPNKEAAHQRVVHDGNLITSQGPGTAMEFALKLVALLVGETKAAETATPLVMP